MTVSFCVIAYNEEHALRSLFEDIKNQSYPHEKIEVILVDSMSTDKTKDLMKSFAAEKNDFMRVLVLDNPKKIQAAGWNVAIKASSCDIIMRIDAHTMIPKDFVLKNVKCIESGENVSGGPRPSIAEEDTPWKHTLLLAESSMFGSSIAEYRRSHHKRYVKSVFHGAYKREVFENAGLFNEDLGRTEDNEMHYRIKRAGYKICYSPNIISYQHTRNTWQGMIRQKYGNGYWIGLTMGVCPQCFSLYHFVPMLFIIAIITALILAGAGIKLPGTILFVCYFILAIVMSLLASKGEKKYWQYVLLPLIFFSLHISYGIGTIVGLIKMPFWRCSKKKRDKK
ncbi:glycosyltransferase family 2 protein [Mediterraneibacter sp. ICN-202921]|uniref:glycosyltransferase family 2 protein n=1 Tax=Mediterraneibacter sp. ICN-202921 TaxID=3134657 RepID=UPI0030C34D6E